MHSKLYILAILQSLWLTSNGLSSSLTISNRQISKFAAKRATMTMRKGRRSIRGPASGGRKRKEKFGNLSNVDKSSSSSTSATSNWVPVSGIASLSNLPKQQNMVCVVDTMAASLVDARSNPTGAVGIVNYNGKTYCVAASCSACKIPLTKSKILPPNDETGNNHPRLECDFCGTTFNARTGEVVNDATKNRGILGGVVRTVFASNSKNTLPTFDLGEKNGKVLIKLPLVQ